MIHTGSKQLRVLVTGSNQGVGYGIIETILKSSDTKRASIHILMTSRNVEAGTESANKLKTQYEGADIEVVELDISSTDSIDRLVTHLKQQGPIDYLVNNAGVATKGPNIDEHVVKFTMGTNYWATKLFTETLLSHSLVNPNGKIVFVSSMAGKFRDLPTRNPDVFAKLNSYKKNGLTVEELDEIVKRFSIEILDESKKAHWVNSVYGQSKLYLSIYSYLLSRRESIINNNIQVYASCPGWVNTSMTAGSGASRTVLEGAETPCYVLHLSENVDLSIQGEFFSNKTKTPLD